MCIRLLFCLTLLVVPGSALAQQATLEEETRIIDEFGKSLLPGSDAESDFKTLRGVTIEEWFALESDGRIEVLGLIMFFTGRSLGISLFESDLISFGAFHTRVDGCMRTQALLYVRSGRRAMLQKPAVALGVYCGRLVQPKLKEDPFFQ